MTNKTIPDLPSAAALADADVFEASQGGSSVQVTVAQIKTAVGAVPSSRTLSTTAPLTGGGDLSADRTLAISAASGSAAGSMSSANFTKLSGIASGATANSSDATLLARGNHTGTQAASTISDFSTAADARITAKVGLSYKIAGNFPNSSRPAVILAAGAAGNNDLYTVPSARKAIVYALMYGNNSGAGTVTFTQQIKISGTYYKISASVAAGAGALGGSLVLAPPILLNAGESFSLNCDIAGLQVQGVEIIEFDDTSTLARAQLTSFSVGLNTLFTVPAGKTAIVGVANLNGQASVAIGYCNQSGATRTVEMYRVPAAYTLVNSSADYPYIIFQNTAANNTLATRQVYSGLAAGDYISIKTDAVTAGQFAWLIYNLLG